MGDVLGGSVAGPGLAVVSMDPVGEDGGEVAFEGGAVHPRLCCATAYGVADDADGDVWQTVAEHAAEVVCHGREAPYNIRGGCAPALEVHVVQAVHEADNAVWPLDGIRACTCRHII